MGRPRGRPRKTENKAILGSNIPEIKENKAIEDEKPPEKEIGQEVDPFFANKSLFRVDEVAYYFGYEKSTIYRWIDHGILIAEKYKGTYRISREAILSCRFRSQVDPLI